MVFMPHWPKPLGFRPSDFSLDRISKMLDKLGNPQNNLPPTVHVAGTNGKGSTIAFMRYILQAAGYKVHVYTSPHLRSFNERIVLAGQLITDEYLYEVLEECRCAAEGIPITFFEATTVASFLAFSRVKADIVLMETGMGGRLDATNVIDISSKVTGQCVNPILTVITSISLEHTQYLGPTVEIIAGEKAGILKNNVSCVVAPQQTSVMRTIEYYAIQKKSPLYRGDKEWFCRKSLTQRDQMIFKTAVEQIDLPLPGLIGDHQIINAGNAIASCSILKGKFNYNIQYENIRDGISNVYWPARLQLINSGKIAEMLPNGWKLFLDGAHNPAGAQVLLEWIKSDVKGNLYVIFGMTQDKDTINFLRYLKPYIKLLCAVCIKCEPRSQTTEEILESTSSLNIKAVSSDSINDAISIILSNNFAEKSESVMPTILICGSLFLAGDVMMEN